MSRSYTTHTIETNRWRIPTWCIAGVNVAILALIMVAAGGCASFKSRTFDAERRAELERHPVPESRDILTQERIAHLPEPVQRYFHHCGWVGREMVYNADVYWEASSIRFGPDKSWKKLQTDQFNSVAEPMRAAFMKARMFGFIPFEGRDLFRDDRGHMQGRLAGLFDVIDAKDREIGQSALITILAEALFVPGYALTPYMSWEPVDSLTVRGRMRYGSYDVSGLFSFNENGEFMRFHTGDRYYSLPKGGYELTPFTTEVWDYVKKDGLRYPTEVRAVWHLTEGDFEYWRGTVSRLDTNVAH